MSVAGSRLLMAMPVLMSALTGCASVSAPVTEPQVASFAMRLSGRLAEQSEPVVFPLSVEEAVARALRYNPTIRARELEHAVAEAKVRADSMAMLPSLVGQSEYYRRDRPLLSHSSLSSTHSSSTDLSRVSRDITLSWNILDFGLAFVRARQGLDKARQQELETYRIKARIVEETRNIYWRTAALQYLGPEITRLDAEIDTALALARRASKDPDIDPTTAINLQRDILTLQRDLNQLHSSLAGTAAELAQLIGAPPGAHVRLAARRDRVNVVAPVSASDADIQMALRQRVEIRQALYDLRITEDEVDATILQALPGLTFSKSVSTDSNSYLQHAHWVSWATKLAGNLVDLARLPANLAVVDHQHALYRQTALATAATIAMQIHVARARLAVHIKAHRDAQRYASAQRDLVAQTLAAVRTGRAGEQVLVRERLALTLAEARSLLALADLHAAAAAYDTAMGTLRAPDATGELADATARLRNAFIVEP